MQQDSRTQSGGCRALCLLLLLMLSGCVAEPSYPGTAGPITPNEISLVREQFRKCWEIPPGIEKAYEYIVVVRLQMEKNGDITRVEIADESRARYQSDPDYRAVADFVLKTTRQCSPVRNMSVAKYQYWRDMELTFDPRILITVSPEGHIYVYDEQWGMDQLKNKLDEVNRSGNSAKWDVVIYGDKIKNAARITQLVDKLHALGYRNITVVGVPSGGPSSSRKEK